MSTPLRSIPPLIPLPDNTSTPAPSTNDKDDLFSTLFSPATPPASPTLKPAPDAHAHAPAPARTRHTRSASAVSVDFGSFVSVPAAEAPLQPAPASSPGAPLTPFASAFFDRFAEDARVATERNQRGFLAELLEHEDDPLYWTHHHAEPERAHTHTPTPTPTPSMPPAPAPAQQPHPRPGEPDGCSDLLLLLDPDSPSALMPDPAHAQPQAPGHPPRAQNTTTPAHAPAPLPPLANTSPVLRSPSLPPASSPTRPTPPLLTRTQSHTTFSTASLPSRWMSSLLAPRSSPAPAPAPPPPSHLPPAHHASLPAAIAGADAGTGAGPGITHGSPFAVHAYAPPSGAPGFAGDRAWDKGFAFDGPALEKRSVRLAGRRETTDAVLSTELADKIRPHLPPLARLHKAWTLLYSLDQHGISLQTLYARCEAHAGGGGGGALVVVRDAGDALFGVWLGDGVRPSKGSYYGSGESFLWRTSAGGDRLHVYKWTGKNDYVALCEPEYLSFGGGDGHYGLYLDDTLLDGSSARCPTFANEPLCAPGPHRGGTVAFECVGLEVWAVGPS